MKQQIKHRYNDKVLFECELADGTENPIRDAVVLAVAQDANLQGAYLQGAYLQGANLQGANLQDANLQGANLQGANLQDANLRGANLQDAYLQGANLQGANLQDAYLQGANLQGANLQDALGPIKADFWMIILSATPEIAGLRLALVEGRVDGSTYQGDCACLVGTIANVRKADYQEIGIKPDSTRAAERWFMGIKKGDTPEKNQISKITVDWLDEFVQKLATAKAVA